MLKQSLALVLLCATGHAFSADIVVNTTEDITKNDQQCSLREAIEYINQGRPEAGLNGCGGKDATNTIILSNKEYTLNSQIRISQSMIFRTAYQNDFGDTTLGKKNAVIRMAGTDRIFQIQRNPVLPNSEQTDELITVVFYEISLQGCSANLCKDKGGLIYNTENLSFNLGKLSKGNATYGGAIYNANLSTANPIDGQVSLTNTLIQGNKADHGAAIYSETIRYVVAQSVVRDNIVNTPNGFVFVNQKNANFEQSENLSGPSIYGLKNNTVFKNKGLVMKVTDGLTLLNNTVILNDKGIVLNTPYKKGFVANNILAQNGNADCQIETTIENRNMSNNLYGSGCVGFASQQLGQTKLIASNEVEGKCDTTSNGILCPFSEYAGHTFGYFRPRLLTSYKQVTDSPIVNRGPKQQLGYISCLNTDQRNKTRTNILELCDRGAIELDAAVSSVGLLGKDITYGEIAKMDISEHLSDGELIPASQCQAIMGNPPNNQPWQAGCMKIIQTNTSSKGVTKIDQNGEVIYTPNGNWHGSDEFKILVVLTTKRLNESNNQYIEVPTRIVQEPPNTFSDYKVKASGGVVKSSGGSLGWLSALGLVGVLCIRRMKNRKSHEK